MSNENINLLPLCATPKIAMRDGYTGFYASILLPFYRYGRWYASGQQYVYPSGYGGQAQGMLMVGTRKPDTFKKDCCNC